MSDNYREELIQVAAVAVAAVQDYDGPPHCLKSVLQEIQVERARQDSKWGFKSRHPFLWNTILTEEVGEVCRATLDMEFKQ